jgi:hypothetical protein
MLGSWLRQLTCTSNILGVPVSWTFLSDVALHQLECTLAPLATEDPSFQSGVRLPAECTVP